MNKEYFMELKQKVIDAGYGEEIVWQESLRPCENKDEFFAQYMWVVLSSGMKNQIARLIEERIIGAWHEGKPTSSVFRHQGKVKAIDFVRANMFGYFVEWTRADNQLEYLVKMPYIGNITKYHLAKNLGVDIAKPDRHLERIARSYETTPERLCRCLAHETGYRIATVDLIIWRSANLGFV
jgi:hypothetical protein